MLDKTGKRIPKPRAKQVMANFLVKVSYGSLKNKTTGEKMDLNSWVSMPSFQTFKNEMSEYGFTRKQLFLTVLSNYKLDSEIQNRLHDFCYSVL